MKNKRNRQTHYGALDDQLKEFILKEYESGNTENTIDFFNYLQKQKARKN